MVHPGASIGDARLSYLFSRPGTRVDHMVGYETVWAGFWAQLNGLFDEIHSIRPDAHCAPFTVQTAQTIRF